MARLSCCSRRCLTPLLLLSAIPLACVVLLERRATTDPSTVEYRSSGWIRECAKWDDLNRRFLVSTVSEGGVSEVVAASGGNGGPPAWTERTVIKDADLAGNASLGVLVDRPRGRLMVVYADAAGSRFSALGAYDLSTMRRIFLTTLSGPEAGPSYADDVAVDAEGNAYVTDIIENRIWKVGPDGSLIKTITNKLFKQQQQWYYNFIGLNGIVYHPSGYLLVVHTSSGHLFKVDIRSEAVSVVPVSGGSLLMGDGMELLSPSRLVVAGVFSGKVVESSDDWQTAAVTASHLGPLHRVASSATVVEGMVYLNHLLGGGVTKWTHVISEAVFSS